jgi:hypothetical protein
MDRHIRAFWGPFRGRVALNFNWPGVINAKSVVHISVSAASLHRPGRYFEDNIARYDNGTTITVNTVSPHDIGVTFVVTVESNNYHYFTTDISVADTLPEQYIWVR